MKACTQDRLLRIRQILGHKKQDDDGNTVVIIEPIIPIGKTAWYQGIADGIYPEPVKLSGRTSAWRESEVLAVVAGTYRREVAEGDAA